MYIIQLVYYVYFVTTALIVFPLWSTGDEGVAHNLCFYC